MRPQWMALRWLGTVALLLAWTGDAWAAEVCIGPEARATVRCDGDRPKVPLGAHQPLAFGVPQPLPPRKPRPLGSPPTSRSLGFRGPHDPLQVRALRRLLVTEIAQLTALLRATPTSSTDRPRLLRRLAETYVELADQFARRKAQLPKKREHFEHREAKARRQAIHHYRLLHTEYPSYCRFPRAPRVDDRSCDDEVLFFWGYELQEAGYPEHARRTYQRLLRRWPGSPHAALGQLALGEVTFDAAQRDANLWPEARRAFEGAISRLRRGSVEWAYAQYKLGYVHWHQNRPQAAVMAFRAALERAKTTPRSAPLLDAARRDIVPVYAEVGDPKQAWDAFAKLSGARPDEDEPTRRMVEELGRKLLDTGRFRDAVTLYVGLSLRPASPAARCRYQAAQVEAELALEPHDKEGIEAKLRRLVQRYEGARDDDICGGQTASLLATTAMAWHVEVTGNPAGTKPVLGTGDAETAQAALRLYRLFTGAFSDAQLARYTFPRLRPEDRPTLARMHYARADLLWSRADWTACAPAFDAARAAAPKGPLAVRAIQASAICHVRRRAGMTIPSETRPRRSLSSDTANTIAALSRYECRIEPAGPEAESHLRNARFMRAELRVAAGHYEAAALDYRGLALDAMTANALARRAARRYLEVLEALRKREARSSCVADARRALPQLRKRHCQSDPSLDICVTFTALERDLGRREAEALIDRADRGGPQQSEHYRKGATLYLQLWRQHGRPLCEKGSEGCEAYAVILHEAARSHARAHELARAMGVRESLVDSSNHLDATPLGIDARRDLGHDHRALGQFAEAANHYQLYAIDHPGRADAAVALADAIVLQVRRGIDPKRAARHFALRFARSEPRLTLEVALLLVEREAQSGDPRKALQELERAERRFEQSGRVALDLEVRTEALLGRLQQSLGAAHLADSHYRRVRNARNQRPALRRAVREAAAHERAGFPRRHRRRFRLAIDAVGEALKHFADQRRKAALSLPRSDDDRAWMRQRKRAIEVAIAAHRPLLELGVASWAMKAGLAIAQLRGQLLVDAEKADGAASFYRAQAKRAYEACLELGVVHQRFGTPLRRCELWLSEHYPLEYHQRDTLEAPSQLLGSP